MAARKIITVLGSDGRATGESGRYLVCGAAEELQKPKTRIGIAGTNRPAMPIFCFCPVILQSGAKATTEKKKPQKNHKRTAKSAKNRNNLKTKSGKQLYSGVLSCIIRVMWIADLLSAIGERMGILTDRRIQSE